MRRRALRTLTRSSNANPVKGDTIQHPSASPYAPTRPPAGARGTDGPRAEPVQQQHVFRVELNRWLGTRELVEGLHRQLEGHRVLLFRSSRGHTEVVLTVAGVDLWQATLTAMALCTQAGYEPSAVEGMPLEEYERRRAQVAARAPRSD